MTLDPLDKAQPVALNFDGLLCHYGEGDKPTYAIGLPWKISMSRKLAGIARTSTRDEEASSIVDLVVCVRWACHSYCCVPSLSP